MDLYIRIDIFLLFSLSHNLLPNIYNNIIKYLVFLQTPIGTITQV